jgi:hypothetical protein
MEHWLSIVPVFDHYCFYNKLDYKYVQLVFGQTCFMDAIDEPIRVFCYIFAITEIAIIITFN